MERSGRKATFQTQNANRPVKTSARISNPHLQTPLLAGIKLPRLPDVILIGSFFSTEPASLLKGCSAIVVRLAEPFRIGADLGLRTLFFQSASRSLLTIRRAALAENIAFSFGGLHAVAAVGLRRRCVRLAAVTEPWFVEDRRLIADPIFRASLLFMENLSSSELEELATTFCGCHV